MRLFSVDACCSLVASRRAAWMGDSELAWVVVLLSMVGISMGGGAILVAGLLRSGLAHFGGFRDEADILMMLEMMLSMALMTGGIADDDVDDDCGDGTDDWRCH